MRSISGSRTRLPAVRPRARFTALPARVDLSPSRAGAVASLVVAGLMVVFAVVAGRQIDAAAGLPGWAATAVPAAILALSALTAGRALFGMLSRRLARFEDGRVRVTGRTLLGREDWWAPLSEFEGVGWRIVRKNSQTSSNDDDTLRDDATLYQVIELIHADPARTLPLHVRASGHGARAEWEGLARALGVPAIDLRDGGVHVRAAEDLDKSVRELAAEGKADAGWDPTAEPPAGISWQTTGADGAETLVVRLHAHRFPVWAYGLIILVGLGVLIGAALSLAWIGIVAGLLLAGGTVAYWRYEDARPRELRVTRREISFVDPMVASNCRSLPHDAIEEIRLLPSPSRLVNEGRIAIASDAGEIRTGEGLSAEALAWLRGYLTSAVVEA